MLDPQENMKNASTAWTLTFVDLLSLMLTFFVLLFSMSSMKSAGWDSMTKSLKKQFNDKSAQVTKVREGDKASSAKKMGLNARYLASVLQQDFKDDPMFSGDKISVRGNKVVINIPTDQLFERNQHILSRAAAKKISGIGIKLAQLPNSVIIAGYSNDQQKVLRPYRNSDEKSLAMARSVAAALYDRGVDNHVTIVAKALDVGLQEHVEIIILDKGVKRGIYELLD